MSEEVLQRLYEALGHRYRRLVLAALAERTVPLSVTDLATEIAAREDDASVRDVSSDRVERIRGRLHHVHVPRLAERGFVEYDPDRRVVALSDRGEGFLSSAERFGEAADD